MSKHSDKYFLPTSVTSFKFDNAIQEKIQHMIDYFEIL
jgi:hypothetical protein